ncbi:hypothetical protein E2C01_005088 [Portunus trituberculatus]|uniref:Uncharacterized protein n=1 Tax=Portunus trituberculatus TaxID=210409 RepID=A0A5B7CTC2_PORTR|nr:hypothetical protein [Portunus trituberculatus]
MARVAPSIQPWHLRLSGLVRQLYAWWQRRRPAHTTNTKPTIIAGTLQSVSHLRWSNIEESVGLSFPASPLPPSLTPPRNPRDRRGLPQTPTRPEKAEGKPLRIPGHWYNLNLNLNLKLTAADHPLVPGSAPVQHGPVLLRIFFPRRLW